MRGERVLRDGLGDAALRTAWGGVPKPLLRVGKAGAGETHANSLRELLAAHGMVKVRFSRPEGVDAACASLAAGGVGVPLMQRGKEVLFATDAALSKLESAASGDCE